MESMLSLIHQFEMLPNVKRFTKIKKNNFDSRFWLFLMDGLNDFFTEDTIDETLDDSEGDDDVFRAAIDGRLEALHRMARKGVDMKGRDEWGRTALWLANANGRTECVAFLRQKTEVMALVLESSVMLRNLEGFPWEQPIDFPRMLPFSGLETPMAFCAALGKVKSLQVRKMGWGWDGMIPLDLTTPKFLLGIGVSPDIGAHPEASPLHVAIRHYILRRHASEPNDYRSEALRASHVRGNAVLFPFFFVVFIFSLPRC